MLIDTFVSLLVSSGKGVSAYVPYPSDKRRQRVSVTFRTNGKAYEYRGTIHDVAEHLGLIPEMNVVEDACRIASELSVSGTSRGYSASIDTVRHMWTYSTWVVSTRDGEDEYDHPMAVYSIIDSNHWQ